MAFDGDRDFGPLPYGRQTIDEDDIQAVAEAMRSPYLTQGPLVSQFEEALARYCGAKYAVAVCNGTAALHIACLAAGLEPGDEHVTSANTFVASANCALYCNATVKLTDIDPATFNMTSATLAPKITAKTKTVIPVHIAGLSCDMREIAETVKAAEKKHGKKIYVIEDASHALGGDYRGNKVGSCEFSDMTVFSFHPVKSITMGEGGAVLTNDRSLYEKLSMLRTHGITKDPTKFVTNPGAWHMEQQMLGYNYRLTDFQGALGMSQLKKLDRFIDRRNAIASFYDSKFAELDMVEVQAKRDGFKSAYHLYVMQIDFEALKTTRKEFMEKLARLRIGTQVHYIPVYLHPYYKSLGFSGAQFPVTENYFKKALSIPIYPLLDDDQAAFAQEKIAALCAL